MDRGIYCLILENAPASVSIGALGSLWFPAGFHVYVGSAQGSGGFSRVCRHLAFARGTGRGPRWHIDYLLRSPGFLIDSVICARTREPLECRMADLLTGIPVPGFGCSDCHCSSHLFFFPQYPGDMIAGAMTSLSLAPCIKTIKG
ncbi:MAG: GIY-YIG nuclease family protein [Methanolinea sp.]|nr:GIY-YIG nuclease family protein [Methanolinea sp.]